MSRIYIKQISEVRITIGFNWYCSICQKLYQFHIDDFPSEEHVKVWKNGHFSKKHGIELPNKDFTGKLSFKKILDGNGK